jgi:hypothetical protein
LEGRQEKKIVGRRIAGGAMEGGRMAQGTITGVRIAEGNDDGRKDEGRRITKNRWCSIRT